MKLGRYLKFRKTLSMVLSCFLLSSVFVFSAPVSAAVYDVTSYGATGNGTTLDTAAIQNAIDAAQAAGGGEVYFPTGTFKTARILLRDNVTLNLSSGAVLKASTSAADWGGANFDMPVLFGENSVNVTIKGTGTIDGGALTYYDSTGLVVSGNHPHGIIAIKNTQNINVSGIKLQNSVKHTFVLYQDDNAVVDGIIIRNRDFALGQETDGIDIDSSRHVAVRNVNIETGDDAICLKYDGDGYITPPRPSYDILVENSTLATTTNATKIGTATAGDIFDVTFRGITVNKHSTITPNRYPIYGATGNVVSAISFQSNDGGAIHNITAENYTINNVETPIFLEQQDRETFVAGVPAGPLYNILLTGITAIHSSRASQINVYSGGNIGNVTLENISIHNDETYSGTTSPPRPNGGYPEGSNYGRMPAYGLFARDVTGLKFNGNINFYNDGSSTRPSLLFENVLNFEQKTVNDDFNSRNTNLQPAAWTIVSNDGSVTVKEMPSSSDKSVKIWRNTTASKTSATKYFTAKTGTVTVEARVMTDSLTGWKVAPYINSSSGASGVNIAFDAGYIKSYNGSTITNVQAFTAGTWYDLKTVINTATNKYDLYVNGVLKMSQATTRSAITNINQIMFLEDSFIGNLYFDNVKVY